LDDPAESETMGVLNFLSWKGVVQSCFDWLILQRLKLWVSLVFPALENPRLATNWSPTGLSRQESVI